MKNRTEFFGIASSKVAGDASPGSLQRKARTHVWPPVPCRTPCTRTPPPPRLPGTEILAFG